VQHLTGKSKGAGELISNRKRHCTFSMAAGLLVLAGLEFIFGPARGSRVEAASTPPKADRIIRYLRERFGVPISENLTLLPFQDAAYPGYYRTTVTAEEGTDKRTSQISVSADGRYLILGDFLPLGADPKAGIVQQVTSVFKLPPTVKLTVGPFVASPFPGFLQTSITAQSAGKENKQNYFVTRNRKFIVLGQIFNMDVDPKREALRVIKLTDQPSEGPANAPVTIVEYADLECPMCAREHQFLQQQLVPLYGGKVRVVFKEFPLVQIHTWAYIAAIANECAYQIDPSKYVAYRTSIFDHQLNLNAATARDLLLYYGQQVGLDRLKLAACIDSKASLPRVEEGLREGKELGVDRTPTFFINGRILIGGGPPEAFFQSVDDALRAAR
jgi:protein-disulfide isomerase